MENFEHSHSDGESGAERTFSLIAAIIVWLQAGSLIAAGLLDLMNISWGRVAIGAGGAIILAGYGLALAIAAGKFLAHSEWTRGLIVFTQLVLLGMAWNGRAENPSWLSPLMAIVAITVMACVFSPPVTRAFSARDSI